MNKEDKIACLVTLQGPTFATDPQPEPPPSFVCPRRVQRLVQQMNGSAGEAPSRESSDERAAPVTPEDNTGRPDRWSPERLVRTCVASPSGSSSFGPMMAAEAQARHFYDAPRRAFVADGAGYNWSLQQAYFRDFEPIVDVLHVLCYVYSSARAVHPDEPSGWSQYVAWMRACWQGRVRDVLDELDRWQVRLGEPRRASRRRRRTVGACVG